MKNREAAGKDGCEKSDFLHKFGIKQYSRRQEMQKDMEVGGWCTAFPV